MQGVSPKRHHQAEKEPSIFGTSNVSAFWSFVGEVAFVGGPVSWFQNVQFFVPAKPWPSMLPPTRTSAELQVGAQIIRQRGITPHAGKWASRGSTAHKHATCKTSLELANPILPTNRFLRQDEVMNWPSSSATDGNPSGMSLTSLVPEGADKQESTDDGTTLCRRALGPPEGSVLGNTCVLCRVGHGKVRHIRKYIK